MANIWLSYNGTALTRNGYGLGINGTTPPEPMPAKTVRFMFEDPSYDPTQGQSWASGSTWSRVSSSPNIWDYSNANTRWDHAFKGKFSSGGYYVHVIDGDLTGVTVTGNYLDGGLFEDNTVLRTVVLRGLQNIRTETTSSDKRGIERTFLGCSNLTSCSLSGFTGCTRYLFLNCTNLRTVSLTDFHPTYASTMFSGCSSLEEAPSFDAAGIIEAAEMFRGCATMTTVPAYNFGSSLTTMAGMFDHCSSLTSVPVFNTASVTDMQNIFLVSGIRATPAWDTGNVRNFSAAFSHCNNLVSIGSLATGNASNVHNMFWDTPNVQGGALSLYTQMSTQSIPPATHDGCFYSCGSYTTTGSAEHAHIPSDWK